MGRQYHCTMQALSLKARNAARAVVADAVSALQHSSRNCWHLQQPCALLWAGNWLVAASIPDCSGGSSEHTTTSTTAAATHLPQLSYPPPATIPQAAAPLADGGGSSSSSLPSVQFLQVPFTRPCNGGQGATCLGTGVGSGLRFWLRGLAVLLHDITLPNGRGTKSKPFRQTIWQAPFEHL
jgi:hypothetical protein